MGDSRRILFAPLRSDLESVDHPKVNQLLHPRTDAGFFQHFPYGGLFVSLVRFERTSHRLPEPAMARDAPEQEVIALQGRIGEDHNLNGPWLLVPHYRI